MFDLFQDRGRERTPMSGIPIQDGDTPHAKKYVDVEVNVDVKAEDKTKEKCPHGNNKGECLVCYRIEVGEHS
jgi:hypothetical protein